MTILPSGFGLICTVLSFSNPASGFLSGNVIVPSGAITVPGGTGIGLPSSPGVTVPPFGKVTLPLSGLLITGSPLTVTSSFVPKFPSGPGKTTEVCFSHLAYKVTCPLACVVKFDTS